MEEKQKFRMKQPFEYRNRSEFDKNLIEWIGDVLYDILPEQGYEIRDEQIYTAFQIADAFTERKLHLAEAGLGTGKTFAYLLSAIPYARFTGKPVVIACATTALQEQLASATGDIATLSKLLDLEVDARMAKDPWEYLCDKKADENGTDISLFDETLGDWIKETKRGERCEVPHVTDRIWKKISWDESMACDTCLNRGYCKLIKAREYYRATRDLIIVDHETFFHDLWSRKDRKLNGKLPILPEYSAVIFDEGHKILPPAAMQAGAYINPEETFDMIAELEDIQGARQSLENVTIALSQYAQKFFEILDRSCDFMNETQRIPIHNSEALMTAALNCKKALDQLLVEFQVEQELYMDNLPETLIQAYEGQIERASKAMARFTVNKGSDVITWKDARDGSFWVVPQDLSDAMKKELYQSNLPIIFTSATLSNEGDFNYFARTIGAVKPSSSTIGSPFDIEHQVSISMLERPDDVDLLAKLLLENEGHALVLTNTLKEVEQLRELLSGYEFPFEILWEDQGDRGYLVRTFKENEDSVLVGADFWEGIDVPGEALTMVIINKLPFPTTDPLIDQQRKDAKKQGLDPLLVIDYPEMGLKLKQGCGRLIRKEDDHGQIILLDKVKDTPWENFVKGALPV